MFVKAIEYLKIQKCHQGDWTFAIEERDWRFIGELKRLQGMK